MYVKDVMLLGDCQATQLVLALLKQRFNSVEDPFVCFLLQVEEFCKI